MVAIASLATASLNKESGSGCWRSRRTRPASNHAARLRRTICALIGTGTLLVQPATAASNKVRVTSLTDVAFGTIANLNTDAIQSQSVCVYADTSTNGYNVTATGTGAGGAFQLFSGAASISYDVLWSSSAGQTSGAQLTPNVPLTGQVSGATHQSCSNGPATSASLVVVLRSTALSSAQAGTYSGTLTLVIGPE